MLCPPCICLSRPSEGSARGSPSIVRFHQMVPSQKQFVGPFVSLLDSHHQRQLSNQVGPTVEPTNQVETQKSKSLLALRGALYYTILHKTSAAPPRSFAFSLSPTGQCHNSLSGSLLSIKATESRSQVNSQDNSTQHVGSYQHL